MKLYLEGGELPYFFLSPTEFEYKSAEIRSIIIIILHISALIMA